MLYIFFSSFYHSNSIIVEIRQSLGPLEGQFLGIEQKSTKMCLKEFSLWKMMYVSLECSK